MIDIFNNDKGPPPFLVNNGTATKCNNSRRASTSSCSDSGAGPGATTPRGMDGVHCFSPRYRGGPEVRASIRHVVRSTHDSVTNQHVRIHTVEISEYEDYSDDDMQETETVLVNLSAAAAVSRAIMTGTNLNLRLVAAGAKESFRYRIAKVEVKTWIRQAAFIHDDELQCYIRRKE